MADPSEEAKLDALWDSTFQTMWRTYYEDLIAQAVFTRWNRIGLFISFFVFGTASGSTLTGLSFWSQPVGKTIWAAFAVLAAVASLFNVVFKVPDRLKEQAETHREFQGIYLDLETLQMGFAQGKPLKDLQTSFEKLRDRYVKAMDRSVFSDFVLTAGLRQRMYNRANREVAKRSLPS